VISDKVSHVHRHLLNLRVVEGLNILQCTTIVNRHEVDRYTLATEPSTTTNPVNGQYSTFPLKFSLLTMFGQSNQLLTTLVLCPLFQDNLGKLVPERKNQSGFKIMQLNWGLIFKSSQNLRKITELTNILGKSYNNAYFQNFFKKYQEKVERKT